ncbi:MAG: RNA methyltransferase [Candidatus Sericytochromatia bacterium]|nr:MAG: RNA methyltransferase [Candidatus Sericytochromatia bacterium]
MNRITSKDNKLIKLAIKLKEKKYRDKKNLFVIEGEKLLNEAIKSNIEIKYIFSTKEIENKNYYLIDNNLMSYICNTDNPSPIFAIAEKINKDFNNLFKNNIILILDKIKDPGNLGTIIRTSEAFNVDTILLTKESVDIYNPKVVRSAMGSLFRINIHYIENLNILNELDRNNFSIFLTTPYSKQNYYDIDYKNRKIVLVIGNESKGLPLEILNNYQSIKIPMSKNIESLNVSVATSIILSEIYRQRLIMALG